MTELSFSVDFASPLADAGDWPAFMADGGAAHPGPVMAQIVAAGRPPRPGAFAVLRTNPIAGVLGPLAMGLVARPSAEPVPMMLCDAPPGPSLAQLARAGGGGRWSDSALVAEVLRPVARTLDRLHAAGITHRAIHPGNVFRPAKAGASVVLGTAWAGPPASLQPALFESLEVGMCDACGRGDGTTADDVHALGVTLAILAGSPTGDLPMLAGLSDEAIVRRKLARGGAACVLENARLSPLMTALLRAMLADDPEHRPTPARLLDLSAVTSRQVAIRPPRQATRPLVIGPEQATDARSLAFALARAPEATSQAALADGTVTLWLRRYLSDTPLAARVDDAVMSVRASGPGPGSELGRTRAMAAIAVLNPQAPLCWGSMAVMPDGIGTALAAADDGAASALVQLVREDAISVFLDVRQDDPRILAWRNGARRMRLWSRAAGCTGGLDRMRFSDNPMLGLTPAMVPGLGPALTLTDLLAGLDRMASVSGFQPGLQSPLGGLVCAFIAARSDARGESELARAADQGAEGREAELALFARLQAQTKLMSLPNLAGWLAARSAVLLNQFREPTRRRGIEARVADCVAGGRVDRLYAVLTDGQAVAAERADKVTAQARLQAIDATIARMAEQRRARELQAAQFGQEVASGIGLAALSLALVASALS